MNGVEPPVNFPVASSSGSNENPPTEVVNANTTRNEIEPQALYGHQMSSDLNASQDFAGGMMKIVPSDVDVSVVIQSNLFLQLIIFKISQIYKDRESTMVKYMYDLVEGSSNCLFVITE